MRVFSFFVSYAYFVLRYLVFALPIVLVKFIQAESVHEFALLACIPIGFFKVRRYYKWLNFHV